MNLLQNQEIASTAVRGTGFGTTTVSFGLTRTSYFRRVLGQKPFLILRSGKGIPERSENAADI